MNKIFETLDCTDRRPVSPLNGDASVLAADSDRPTSRKVTQITSPGVAIADEPSSLAVAEPAPMLEMDPATRLELIRLISSR